MYKSLRAPSLRSGGQSAEGAPFHPFVVLRATKHLINYEGYTAFTKINANLIQPSNAVLRWVFISSIKVEEFLHFVQEGISFFNEIHHAKRIQCCLRFFVLLSKAKQLFQFDAFRTNL